MRVDGVSYTIDWMEFTVGSSFFIPCLSIEEGTRRVKRKMDRLGYPVVIKSVIENEIRGLRVWRKKKYTPYAT